MTPAPRHFDRHACKYRYRYLIVFRHSRPCVSAAACPHATRYQSLSSTACFFAPTGQFCYPRVACPMLSRRNLTTRTIIATTQLRGSTCTPDTAIRYQRSHRSYVFTIDRKRWSHAVFSLHSQVTSAYMHWVLPCTVWTVFVKVRTAHVFLILLDMRYAREPPFLSSLSSARLL